MKYVVIGASGFIGRNLVRSLDAAAVDRNVVDLSDKSAADKLAPLVEGKNCFFCASIQPKNGNIDVARNFAILEPFLKVANRCEHLTYLSSDAVYPYDCLVTEDTPVIESSTYAASHLAREQALKDEVGHKLLIARLTQVYGAEDTHNAYGPCRMVREALSGGPIVLKGEGEERRDHLNIDDLIKLLSNLSEKRETGILNLATGLSLTFREMAQAVSALIPSEIVSEPRARDITHRDFDVTKLKSVCSWYTPTPLSLENMIEEIDGRKTI